MDLRWTAVAAMLAATPGCRGMLGGARDAGAPDAGPTGPVTLRLPATRDGWQLAATLWSGAPGAPTGAVLLLHQLGSDRDEWRPLVERLQRAPAVMVLALDLRGHGDSVQGPTSTHQRWEEFGDDATRWVGVAVDAAAGLRPLVGVGGARTVVAIGSSLGGSAAFAGLASEPRVVGLGWVSPGLAYRGLDAVAPLHEFVSAPTAARRSLWMIAAEGDPGSTAAMATLAGAAGSVPVVRTVVAGSDAHGVALLNADPARWDALDRWARDALGVARSSAR